LEELSIHINIAGRIYPLLVTPTDEQAVREAGKLINEKLLFFKEQFSTKDNQDALAMFALQHVTDAIKEKALQQKMNETLNKQLNNVLEVLNSVNL
jgi:cell division protein ZapA